MQEYKWKIKSKVPQNKKGDWLLKLLAQNRNLDTPKKLQNFLNPTIEQILDVKPTQMEKGKKRIAQAIQNKEKIVVYADYDADGLCATAIMWETLFDLGADVMPYVPHRIKEGYGMSIEAISEMAKKGVKLIITVDQGVTAVKQVEHAKKLAIDVIITDHHVLPEKTPDPFALVHSTALCGAGVAWRFCWEIVKELKGEYEEKLMQKLELAALATIADLVPLVGGSRAIVKFGLEKLTKTKRPGILALMRTSKVKGAIGTYEIGHILAPRINAMGRLEHGLDSLRLICAKNQKQADELAKLLTKTNTKRQDLTIKAVESAFPMIEAQTLIGVVSHESWHEGVIGLVASRLVEAHHRPMIAISKGQELSKGSARSIPGFNIIEAIRESSEFLVDAGGHPMAAGFTIKTEHIEIFKSRITKFAQRTITEEILVKKLDIECELDPEDITFENFKIIQSFQPYGMGNPSPYFVTKGMTVEDVRTVGQESKHLKLQLDGFSAIAFNMGSFGAEIRPGYQLDVVYSPEEDKYANNRTLQLKIKDIKVQN